MARHFGYPFFGVPYCADSHPSQREVHDLDYETPNCRVYEIMAAGRAVPFHMLAEGHAAGYADCAH